MKPRIRQSFLNSQVVWPTVEVMALSTDNAQMTRLADTLWHERRLLEYLLFKLVSANLVLVANDRRFVGPAIAEVDRVMGEIRKAEQQRTNTVAAIADDWNLSAADVGLDFLVEHSTDALQATFEDHRDVFRELVAEIEVLTNENRKLATVGLDRIRGTLGLAGGDIYNVHGRTTPLPDVPTRVDRVL